MTWICERDIKGGMIDYDCIIHEGSFRTGTGCIVHTSHTCILQTIRQDTTRTSGVKHRKRDPPRFSQHLLWVSAPGVSLWKGNNQADKNHPKNHSLLCMKLEQNHPVHILILRLSKNISLVVHVVFIFHGEINWFCCHFPGCAPWPCDPPNRVPAGAPGSCSHLRPPHLAVSPFHPRNVWGFRQKWSVVILEMRNGKFSRSQFKQGLGLSRLQQKWWFSKHLKLIKMAMFDVERWFSLISTRSNGFRNVSNTGLWDSGRSVARPSPLSGPPDFSPGLSMAFPFDEITWHYHTV